MSLAPGVRLSSYEILGTLGAGAMGVVWRARDTRLEREVAIKVLPEHFADDAERLRRFEREAKTLASLNHPNVAQIFGVDQVGDTCFLVLELVEGESLEERLKRGALPLDEALDVCRQIAEGLEAAHEAGVIHRDLKPANIRLTPDGRVKVLDFGLAKPIRAASAEGASTDSVLSTEAGRLLGTPTYMAPEQARGKPIDKRVDIWAFGCVLYECLTGRRAFAGETLSDVLGAVMHTQPDLSLLPAQTPRAVRELMARCFEKDPHKRVRDIGEARLILQRGQTLPPEDVPTASRSRAWWAVLWVAGVGGAIGVTMLLRDRPAPASAPLVRTFIDLPPDLSFEQNDGSLALSPDGHTLVLCAKRGEERLQLWVRSLDSLTPQPLAGTEGASYPFWSPDGRTIGFFADGRLKRILASGGAVTSLCAAADPRGGTWTSRDEIIFAPSPFGGLSRVPATGGVPAALTTIEGRASHRVPHALPDGRRVLFAQGNSEQDGIKLLDLETGAITSISDDSSDAHYVEPGALLFVRDGNLMGQDFDQAAGRLTGQPRLVAERVTFDMTRLAGRYSASTEGTLIYQSRSERRLEWFDLDGTSLGRIGIPAEYAELVVAPDGQHVMASVARAAGGVETWLIDGRTGLGAAQPELERCSNFAWSPDSRSYAYALDDNTSTLHIKTLDGAGESEFTAPGGPTDWSPDGKWLALMRQEPGTGLDVLVIRADGSGEPQPIAATTANEVGGLFSPDSRWLLYGSDVSGQYRGYAAPVGRPGMARAITAGGASSVPVWLADGRIVCQTPSGELGELSVTPRGDEFDIGESRLLFGGRKVPTASIGSLAIARDGKRLLAIVPESGAGAPPLVVVQHWQAADTR